MHLKKYSSKVSTILILFIISLLTSNLAKSNSKDSLVIHFNELVFNSTIEKETFEKIENEGLIDYTQLFLSVNKNTTQKDVDDIKLTLKKLMDELKTIEIKKGKEEKSVKKISGTIHSQMLKKYQLNINFDEIFNLGEYNCVTASALFAIAFNELKIPYNIIELPTHVYLIAYPDEKSIEVETTNALLTYGIIDNNIKKEYVTYLLDNKIISINEYNNSSIEDLFTKNYYGESIINLRQLAGLHYFNNGISLSEKDQNQKAYEQFSKAYYLFPSERIKYAMMQSLANTFTDYNYLKPEFCSNLSQISRFKWSKLTNETIIGEYKNLTNKLLVESTDTINYFKISECLINKIEDTTLLNEISFTFNYNMFAYYYQNEEYLKALSFSEKAYQLKPNHIYTKKVFLELVAIVSNRDNDLNNLSEILMNYEKKYPELSNDDNIIKIHVLSFLSKAHDEFVINNNPAKSLTLLNEFEQKYPKDQIHNININNAMEDVYGKLILYYFGKGNKAKSKELTLRALKYCPESYYFKRKLEVFN